VRLSRMGTQPRGSGVFVGVPVIRASQRFTSDARATEAISSVFSCYCNNRSGADFHYFPRLRPRVLLQTPKGQQCDGYDCRFPRVPNYHLLRRHEADPFFGGIKPVTFIGSLKSVASCRGGRLASFVFLSYDGCGDQIYNDAQRTCTMNLHRLDLNLLVALDVLLAERSITRAAERLNLSPSATSGALARLRTYFDDEILTQIGRRMAPTPLGESLQASVRDCLLHVQATIDNRPHFDPLNSKRNFRLMMSDYVSTVLMPRALRRLQREAPGITIELVGNQNEPWEALASGDIEFLVLPQNFIRPDHPSEILFEDDYVCVCWRDNPLIGDEISQSQCLEIGHVVARIGTLRPPTIDAWFFERFGHARRVEVIATNFNCVPHLLVGTHRISIMHRRLALAYSKMLPLKILASPIEMPRLVEMIQWHKYRDRDPGRVWLFELLKSAADGSTE